MSEESQVIEWFRVVRRRPGMYIGSTGSRGLYYMVHEVLNNSIEEAMAGYCNEINIIIHKDDSITIRDNSRGISVDNHPIYKIPFVEVMLTNLHAINESDNVYRVSGGIHGIGSSVVCALSAFLTIRIKRDGKIYQQSYQRGKKTSELIVIEECDINDTGTQITFQPDKEIFENIELDYKNLKERLRELAFLLKGVQFSLKNEKSEKKDYIAYYNTRGVAAFVDYLLESTQQISESFYFKREVHSVVVEVAISYAADYTERIHSFVNTTKTLGGTHTQGFLNALTQAINNYARKANLLKEKEEFRESHVREGLCAIINLNIPDPLFEGASRTVLANSEVREIVSSIVYEQLGLFLEKNSTISKRIIAICRDALSVLPLLHAFELSQLHSSQDLSIPRSLFYRPWMQWLDPVSFKLLKESFCPLCGINGLITGQEKQKKQKHVFCPNCENIVL
ncbi:MAG: ATP-binding protein [Candidatus Hermodarchaeota archaeon]